jgi:hypothetical protein
MMRKNLDNRKCKVYEISMTRQARYISYLLVDAENISLEEAVKNEK